VGAVTGVATHAELHVQRLDALESGAATTLKALTDLDRHRERMETRWSIVTAAVAALAVGGLALAGTTRDTTRDNAARIAVIDAARTESADEARSMAAEGRSTHDAIVRLTGTVDALRVRVEELTSELHSRPAGLR
jgi:predicted LPLAT superfamily acyltransferase